MSPIFRHKRSTATPSSSTPSTFHDKAWETLVQPHLQFLHKYPLPSAGTASVHPEAMPYVPIPVPQPSFANSFWNERVAPALDRFHSAREKLVLCGSPFIIDPVELAFNFDHRPTSEELAAFHEYFEFKDRLRELEDDFVYEMAILRGEVPSPAPLYPMDYDPQSAPPRRSTAEKLAAFREEFADWEDQLAELEEDFAYEMSVLRGPTHPLAGLFRYDPPADTSIRVVAHNLLEDPLPADLFDYDRVLSTLSPVPAHDPHDEPFSERWPEFDPEAEMRLAINRINNGDFDGPYILPTTFPLALTPTTSLSPSLLSPPPVPVSTLTPPATAATTPREYVCPHAGCPIRTKHRTGSFCQDDTDKPYSICFLELNLRGTSLSFDELMLLHQFYDAHSHPLQNVNKGKVPEPRGHYYQPTVEDESDYGDDEDDEEEEEQSECDAHAGAEEETKVSSPIELEADEVQALEASIDRLIDERIEKMLDARAGKADKERLRVLLELLTGGAKKV